MENSVIEASYPLTFRQEDARELGNHLKNSRSVVLIGMKRVGISNFLRFFLHQKDIVKTYIADNKNYLFISVDLNDLVELELFPFWTLVLKRIADASETSILPTKAKKYIQTFFLESIQSQDLFFTIDCVRRSLVKIVENAVLPILFLIRFDRLKTTVTPQFFANLQGLKDATSNRLSYVFTSYRSLDKLSPSVFSRATLSVFSEDLYIKPANKEDIKIVFQTYANKHRLNLPSSIEQAVFETVDGYIQYLQLVLILLHETKLAIMTKAQLFDHLIKDESITLQSEELWESLDGIEQKILLRVSKGETIAKEEKEKGKYLWETGFIFEKNGRQALFSSLFDYYLKQREKEIPLGNQTKEFTRKENALFLLLQQNLSRVCEREKIVENVWSEVEAFGVSDWAIDRLVARVRNKLKLQKSEFEIQTVKTRGYKLVSTG